MNGQIIKIHLTKPMVSKLIKGRGIQLKPEHLQKKEGVHRMELTVSLPFANKYSKAVSAGRGIRIQASDVDGGSIKDIWEKIKAGAKTAKKFYDKNLKSTLGPIAKKGLDTLIKAGEAALVASFPATAPAVAVFDQKIREPLVDKVGDLTGAYGLGLTKLQARKLIRGLPVQLRHEQLSGGCMVKLGPGNIAKIEKAKRSGKGCRLHLGQGEGEGLKEIAAFAKRVKKMYEERVPEPIKKAIRTKAKKVFDEGVERIVKKIEGGAIGMGKPQMISRAIDSVDPMTVGLSGISTNNRIVKFQPYIPIVALGDPKPRLSEGSSFSSLGGSFRAL